MGSVAPEPHRSSQLDASIEAELCWSTGAVLMRTQAAGSTCQRAFRRNDLAFGILFQKPGSEVTWQLEGKEALAKVWTEKTNSNELVILPPRSEFVARCQGSGQGLWLFVDPVSVAGNDRIAALTREPLVDNSWAKDRLAWMIISEIRQECANGFPRGPMFLENATGMFIAQLGFALRGASRVAADHPLSPIRLATTLDYIESNLHRNITLAELGALVDLTPRYFCAAFRQAMGQPPHQFQIERRIERAKALLPQSKLSLTDIALTVGFSSQSHLNDHFRRIVGQTPARYRADARSSAAQQRRAED
jgi:AraC family transcriptional regulator